MKVPPKRKGNHQHAGGGFIQHLTLNESPSEKEGKSLARYYAPRPERSLNESPSEKEGKSCAHSSPRPQSARPQ